MYDEDWHPEPEGRFSRWVKDHGKKKRAVDRIPDWTIGVTIFLVMCAMLGAPLWICALKTACRFAQ